MILRDLLNYYVHCSRIGCYFKFPYVNGISIDSFTNGVRYCSAMCLSEDVLVLVRIEKYGTKVNMKCPECDADNYFSKSSIIQRKMCVECGWRWHLTDKEMAEI